MMPDKHIIWGVIIALGMFLLGFPLITILLLVGASILIDVDHLFYYVARFKNYNLVKMNKYFRSDAHLEDPANLLPILIFHNLETMLLLGVLSIFFPLMTTVWIGILFHLILDWITMPTTRYPLIIKLSLIEVILENKNRKRGEPRW